MHVGDWLTLGIAVIFAAALILWRIKAAKNRRAAPPPRHSNAHRPGHNEAERIKNGGLERPDWAGRIP